MSHESNRSAADELAELFEQSGYVRRQNRAQLTALGHRRYKKGSEIRLVLRSAADARRARMLLDAVGLAAGASFAKNNRIVVPVYGVHAVKWFVTQLRRRRSLAAIGFAPSGARLWHRAPQRGSQQPSATI